jgi:prephenate dehydrogenase
MKLYEQVTIIGVGLLGASLGKAMRHEGLVDKIIGYGRNQDNLKNAVDLKIIDRGAKDLKSAVENSDLIIICVPVGRMASVVKELMPSVKTGCHITDVGSVKGPLVEELENIIGKTAHFIGSHPLAGGEKSGLSDSNKDLFNGARCIVTPTSSSDSDALKKVSTLWEKVGMSVSTMDAEEHDKALGAVSHLPHVVAFALMNTVGDLKTSDDEKYLSFSAGGLRDTTRIASSDPVMWRDICTHNSKQVLKCIDLFQKSLGTIKEHIEKDEGGNLEESFKSANNHRLKLTG